MRSTTGHWIFPPARSHGPKLGAGGDPAYRSNRHPAIKNTVEILHLHNILPPAMPSYPCKIAPVRPKILAIVIQQEDFDCNQITPPPSRKAPPWPVTATVHKREEEFPTKPRVRWYPTLQECKRKKTEIGSLSAGLAFGTPRAGAPSFLSVHRIEASAVQPLRYIDNPAPGPDPSSAYLQRF